MKGSIHKQNIKFFPDVKTHHHMKQKTQTEVLYEVIHNNSLHREKQFGMRMTSSLY